MIKQERLKHVLRYEPDTGNFYWLEKENGRNMDKPAGYNKKGCIVININGEKIVAHKLAWLYMTGEYRLIVNQRDGNKANNKFYNLGTFFESWDEICKRKSNEYKILFQIVHGKIGGRHAQ